MVVRSGRGEEFEKLVCPGVVSGAVDDDDPSVGNTAHHRGRSLEQVRILIRIVEDTDDLGVASADPLRDAAIDVLGRDNSDRAGSRRRKGKAEA